MKRRSPQFFPAPSNSYSVTSFAQGRFSVGQAIDGERVITPRLLGAAVLMGIERGEIQNLFIVLQVPTTTPFPGVSGQPLFVGLDGGATNRSAE